MIRKGAAIICEHGPGLAARLIGSAEARPDWKATVEAVADRTLDPITAAQRLLEEGT